MLRFTESDKWLDPWFQQLSPEPKLFYLYLLDTVDHAGVWEENWRMAEFLIGQELDQHTILEELETRVFRLGEDKLYLPKFIAFQLRGKELRPDYNPHKGIVKALAKSGLEYKHGEGLTKPCPSLAQGFQGTYTEQYKEQDNGNAKVLHLFKDEQQAEAEEAFDPIKVQEAFNELCPSLPKVRELTPKRRKAVIKLHSTEFGDDLGEWREFFARIESSQFLTGRSTKWKASFDWVLKPANLTKIKEGNYNDTSRTQDHAGGF